MLPYCDFAEQETVTGESGRLRPDLVVKLPGGKNVVVDAKTPLQAFLEAFETTDEEARRACLANHARQVRDHMKTLSGKNYWEQFEATPEFVVMFLPGETFFSAALEQDPTLIEQGVLQRVIPASPTTLIALLKAVAYGWNQEKLARNAQQISALGKELHERLRKLAGHITGVGTNLDRAVEAYNQAVGSLENRVLVSARKFSELGASVAEDIPELEPIETTARALSFEWDDETVPEVPEEGRPQGGVKLGKFATLSRDPSLRLKSGYAQDDAIRDYLISHGNRLIRVGGISCIIPGNALLIASSAFIAGSLLARGGVLRAGNRSGHHGRSRTECAAADFEALRHSGFTRWFPLRLCEAVSC